MPKLKIGSLPAATKKPAKDDGNISLAIASVSKVLKNRKASIERLSQETNPIVGWVKTGIWPLDWLISNFRGIPLGRGMIVWGAESLGKSSLMAYIVLCFQRWKKKNGMALWFDHDDAIDVEIMGRQGIDFSRVVVPSVSCIEDGDDAIRAFVESMYEGKDQEAPLAVVWDAINSIDAKANLKASASDTAQPGRVAMANRNMLLRMRTLQHGRPISLFLTAEMRDKIGGMPGWGGPQGNLTGGKAVKHYPTTILKLTGRKLDKHKKTGDTLGMWVYTTAEKARKGKMGRRSMFYISFDEEHGGPDPVRSNYQFLKDKGMLKARGAEGVTIRGLEKTVGVFKLKTFGDVMKEHEKVILAKLKEALSSKGPDVDLDDDDGDMDE